MAVIIHIYEPPGPEPIGWRLFMNIYNTLKRHQGKHPMPGPTLLQKGGDGRDGCELVYQTLEPGPVFIAVGLSALQTLRCKLSPK